MEATRNSQKKLSGQRELEPSRRPRPIRPDFQDFQNPYKVFCHLQRVTELRETGDTRPVHMTIGLTNYCNHKCPWCFINWNQAGRQSVISSRQGTRNKAINADWRIVEAVEEALNLGLKAVTIVGDGEPSLHPEFSKILKRLAALRLDVGVFTNFSMKEPKLLEDLLNCCFFIRGSIDAASPEIHSMTHGVNDFERVIGNLRRLIGLRGERELPIIGVQYVTNQWNCRQLPEAAEFYRDVGVDYMTIKPAYRSLLNPEHPRNEIPFEEVLRLMKQAEQCSTNDFTVYAKYPQFQEVLTYETNNARYYQKCLATPFSPYLDEDGGVEMCGNLKGRGFTMGNVFEQSFQEIWKSARRRDCLNRIDLSQCPAGCKLDPLNKVLWDCFNPERKRIHPNFI